MLSFWRASFSSRRSRPRRRWTSRGAASSSSTDREMGRRLAILLVNILVFCVAAEAAGLLVYYYEHGWLFYAQQRQPYELIESTREGRLTGEGLHPYFGPTHKPGTPFDIPEDLREPSITPARAKTNNFGFVS